jgi:hypothetical protein
MHLNEYEIEFMFRKIPDIVMSRTDAQNGLDFHFKFSANPALNQPTQEILPH